MLTFVRGLPGSGKSTTAKKLLGDGAIHLETDMFWGVPYDFDSSCLDIAHAWCQGAVAKELYSGMDVVISNTFVNRKEFIPYLKLAVRFGHLVNVVECTGSYGSIHSVPEHAINRMRDNWEPMDLTTLIKVYEHIKYGELF